MDVWSSGQMTGYTQQAIGSSDPFTLRSTMNGTTPNKTLRGKQKSDDLLREYSFLAKTISQSEMTT